VVGFCVVGEQEDTKMMTRSGFHSKLRLLAVVGGLALAACVLVLMATHKPAEAAFPGTNGKIVFDRTQLTGSVSDSELYTITSDGKSVKRLTNNSFDDATPAYSPDGKRIAFTSNRYSGTDYDIFIMNPGFGVKNLTNTQDWEASAAWSPDGRKIAFARGSNLFVRNANGTNERLLTDVSFNASPSWSPDGSKIVFSSTREGFGITDLWVMNADGTDPRRLTDPPPEGCHREFPDWSPDGTKVVFSYRCFIEEDEGIYVINADGSGQKRLVASGINDFDEMIMPAWSPNGRKIAFVCLASGRVNDLFVMRADGTNSVNYTNTPEAAEFSPSWQPVKAPSG
jgi:Tol biopolymer transport system component